MAKLSGMKQICDYYGYSEVTILKLIRERDFPAHKVTGGIWESDTNMIDKWRDEQIENGVIERKKNGKKRSRK